MTRYGISCWDYTAKVMGWNLIPEQRQILELMSNMRDFKNLAITCGRGFSKSSLASSYVTWVADEYASGLSNNGKGRDISIMLVSSQDTIYTHLNRIFANNKESFGYDEETGKFSRLKRGGMFDVFLKNKAEIYTKDFKHVTTIYPVNATPKAVRGKRADIIVADEVADHPRDVFVSYQGCFTGDINKFILLSTPHRQGSIFNDIVGDPEKFKYKVYNASAELAPWQKKANERAKEILTLGEYAMEIHGRVPSKEERSYFPHKHIEACVHDIEPFPEGGTNSWKEVGIDWGYAENSGTTYVLTERIGSVKRKVLRIMNWKGLSIEEELSDEIAKLLAVDQPKYIKADSKPTYYKGHVEKKSKKTLRYIDAAHKVKDYTGDGEAYNDKVPTVKEHMLGQLQRKLREHNLIIPIHLDGGKKLIEQLQRYRRGMTVGDDYVDALCLSCYEPINGFTSTPSMIVFGTNDTMMF